MTVSHPTRRRSTRTKATRRTAPEEIRALPKQTPTEATSTLRRLARSKPVWYGIVMLALAGASVFVVRQSMANEHLRGLGEVTIKALRRLGRKLGIPSAVKSTALVPLMSSIRINQCKAPEHLGRCIRRELNASGYNTTSSQIRRSYLKNLGNITALVPLMSSIRINQCKAPEHLGRCIRRELNASGYNTTSSQVRRSYLKNLGNTIASHVSSGKLSGVEAIRKYEKAFTRTDDKDMVRTLMTELATKVNWKK